MKRRHFIALLAALAGAPRPTKPPLRVCDVARECTRYLFIPDATGKIRIYGYTLPV